MVWHFFRPAHGTEKDRVEAFELFKPVVRHHLAVLQVVIATGPFEVFELQLQTVLRGGSLNHAYAFGQYFKADAVTGDGSNTQFLVVHVGHSCRTACQG